MAHHYEEPKGKFSPYQVKLGDGSLIYAPYDDDQCIRKVNTELRFDIGEEVQCWYNERWERGRVVQHDYEEPQAVFHPYQVELHNNVLIYAPKDDDDHIQIARRFEVGACVLCRCSRQTSEDQSEQWVTGHVVRYNVVDRDGKVCPYEVKLENGKLVNVLEDVDKFICITKEDAKVEKAQTAPRYDFTVLQNALWIWRQSFAMSREAEAAGGMLSLISVRMRTRRSSQASEIPQALLLSRNHLQVCRRQLGPRVNLKCKHGARFQNRLSEIQCSRQMAWRGSGKRL